MKTFNFIIILFSFLFYSCEHKELCYDHPHSTKIRVVFDWKEAPNANPEVMRLYLFPSEGGDAIPYEFVNIKGGEITVPIGKYKAICVNSDTESILYRNDNSYLSFEAYTVDGVLPRTGKASERVSKSPDPLWSDNLDVVNIEASKELQVITMVPKMSVSQYRVIIKNVENLKYIKSGTILGSLSSMSGGLLIGQNQLTTELVTLPFEIHSDNVSTLTTDFLAFGHCPSIQESHVLTIYVVMEDGNKYYYQFDVTAQLHSAVDPKNVLIELDKLPLPKPIVNGGGFQPSVEEWQSVNIDIQL